MIDHDQIIELPDLNQILRDELLFCTREERRSVYHSLRASSSNSRSPINNSNRL